jgi:hypothetical protein
MMVFPLNFTKVTSHHGLIKFKSSNNWRHTLQFCKKKQRIVKRLNWYFRHHRGVNISLSPSFSVPFHPYHQVGYQLLFLTFSSTQILPSIFHSYRSRGLEKNLPDLYYYLSTNMTGSPSSLQHQHCCYASLTRIYFRFIDPALARKYSADSMAFSIFDFDETSSALSLPANVVDRLRRLLTTVMAFECPNVSDRKIIPELISTFTFRNKYGDILDSAFSVDQSIVEALKCGESGMTVVIESASSATSAPLPVNVVCGTGRSSLVEADEVLIPTPKSLLMMVQTSTYTSVVEPTTPSLVASFPPGFRPLQEEAEERESNRECYMELNLNHQHGDVRDGYQLPYVLSESSILGEVADADSLYGVEMMMSLFPSQAFLLPAFYEGQPTPTSPVGSSPPWPHSSPFIDQSLLMLGHESDMVCILESVSNIVD